MLITVMSAPLDILTRHPLAADDIISVLPPKVSGKALPLDALPPLRVSLEVGAPNSMFAGVRFKFPSNLLA